MLAGEAIEAGEFSGEMFWKAVKTIQDLLSDAADSTCGGSFRYCRLPEFKEKCGRCEVAGLPCLKTSKTGKVRLEIYVEVGEDGVPTFRAGVDGEQ